MFSDSYKTNAAMAVWMVTVHSVTYSISAPFFCSLSEKWGRGIFYSWLIGVLFCQQHDFFLIIFYMFIVSHILAGLFVASTIPLNYALLEILHHQIEEEPGYPLLFAALDCSLDRGTDRNLVEIWFYMIRNI